MLPIAAGFSRCFSFHPANSAAFSDNNQNTDAQENMLHVEQTHVGAAFISTGCRGLGFVYGDCRQRIFVMDAGLVPMSVMLFPLSVGIGSPPFFAECFLERRLLYGTSNAERLVKESLCCSAGTAVISPFCVIRLFSVHLQWFVSFCRMLSGMLLSGTLNAEHLAKRSLCCSAGVESSVFPFCSIRCFRLSAYFFLCAIRLLSKFYRYSVDFRP